MPRDKYRVHEVAKDFGLNSKKILGSFCFIFSGFAIFGSSFFTALNDGITSAILAFLRTIVFQVTLILTLPLLFQLDGVWMSSLFAEVLAFCSTVAFIWIYRKRFNYL